MLENFPVIYTRHISIPLVSIFEVRALFNLNVAGKRHKIQELKLIYLFQVHMWRKIVEEDIF